MGASLIVCHGNDGYYHFTYLPTDKADVKALRSHASTIAEWMDQYDLVFSRSRCEFGVSRTHLKGGKDMLEIIVQHPPYRASERELDRRLENIEDLIRNRSSGDRAW